jgi:hypothetical protein
VSHNAAAMTPMEKKQEITGQATEKGKSASYHVAFSLFLKKADKDILLE